MTLDGPMNVILLLKLVLVPGMVAMASLAARRYGLAVGSFLAGLPITGGPILAFLALDQGMPFAAHAALGALLGTLTFSSFCLAYAWCARVGPWWLALPAGLAAYGLMLAPVAALHLGVWQAAGLAVATLLTARACLPRLASAMVPAPSRWDLPLRMAAAVAVVLGVTGGARLMGAQVSGVLTTFPTVASILGVFLHRSAGAGAAVTVFRGLSLGMLSYVLFVLVVALRPPLSLGWTLVLAVAVALACHGLLLLGRSRSGRLTGVPAAAATAKTAGAALVSGDPAQV